MKPVVFVTANQGKHAEVERLLAGITVRWARLGIPRPVEAGGDLESIAKERARSAYAELGEPCFLENTGLYLYDHRDEPGASFKRVWRELGEEAFAARYGGSRGVARVVVALAEGPNDIRTFSGSVAGTLLERPRGEGGYGWARLWMPDGFDRTLAELGASTYVLNMRAVPYLALGDHLRGQPFAGTFEAHVTVAPLDAAGVLRFRAACSELGVKCIVIELPAGDTPTQPMTATFHRGELRVVQEEVIALAREIARRGFEITRTKIEAHGPSRYVPETDEDAAKAPSTSYFEYHLKLATPAGIDLASLAEACAVHGARLSRNAHARAGKDGLEERFVTLRVYREGRVSAEARFGALTTMLMDAGHAVRSRIREYTVFDTNVGVDRGWIDSC